MSRRAGRARTPAAPQSPHNANPVGKGLRRTRSVRPTTVPPPLSAAGAGKVRLGDVCEEVSVRNRDGKVSSVCSVTNSEGFIPSTEYFSKEVYSKSLATYKIVKPGMFAYNPSRINVGSVNRWIGEAPVIVSPLYIVVNPDPRRIEGSYLNYFLHSKEALCQIRNLTEGTVRDSLKFSGFQRLTLPLPPLPTQQRIADELDRLCALKKNAEDRLAILDQIVKSRFVEMFGGGCLSDEKQLFSEICEFVTVGIANSATHVYAESGVPMLRNQNIREGSLDDSDLVHIKSEFAEKYRSKTLKENDLLIVRTGYPGVSCVVPKKYEGAQTFTTLIARLRDLDETDPVFVCHYLNSPYGKEYVDKSKVGIAQQNFGARALEGMPIFIPHISLQREFAAFVAEVDKSKLTLRETVATLDQLYRAKLQEYFG